MNELTEQYNNDALPDGEYYYKLDGKVGISTKSALLIFKSLADEKRNKDIEIIAPVPSYEWVVEHSFKPFSQREFEKTMAENRQLKNLLREARIYVAIDTQEYEDRAPSKSDADEAKTLLKKIDEVLK